MKYIVLGGGISPERDVSKRSAAGFKEALESLGHEVVYLDPAEASVQEIIAEAKYCDAVFPILHGEGGEDGMLQAQLFDAGIAYFGPDATACANTFDKVIFKKLLEQHDVLTPPWNTVSAASFANEPLTKQPFVVKPITGGSSIDTFIVRSIPFDSARIAEALSRYETMLIEKLIEGREITVGILNDQALPVVEIIPPSDQEFDYENKYNGATQELCPPLNVNTQTQQDAQALALNVHTITRCRHLSRTDMMIDADNDIYVIDTNTLPGLTNQSLYPKAAAEAGLQWNQLVDTFAKAIK